MSQRRIMKDAVRFLIQRMRSILLPDADVAEIGFVCRHNVSAWKRNAKTYFARKRFNRAWFEHGMEFGKSFALSDHYAMI